MRRFYLNGQRNFANRGCEAIVRSTVAALRDVYGDVDVLVPSDDIQRDAAQWPDSEHSGVRFVPAYTPWHTRYWVHTQRLPMPFLKRAGWPFPFPRWVKEQLATVDAVLSVGGDNYSLDYRLPSFFMGMDGLAMQMGKPVVLWGASVGPFEREPEFVPVIRRHLDRMDQILVRESVSYAYLTGTMGLENVKKTVDPAFILRPEAVIDTDFWPERGEQGVIGLNVSPLIERYRKSGESMLVEAEGFIRTVVKNGFAVLLVPHVVPLSGARKNNDAYYMNGLLEQCVDLGSRISMAPSGLNAPQIKHVISQLRFFIGARTHATIAALSSGVPTISIGYSIKSEGINRDLFGHTGFVIRAAEMIQETLLARLAVILQLETEIRTLLNDTMPRYCSTVHAAASLDPVRV